ncbi:MAG TPA: SLC13 family permease, partial [Rhodothermales bacterium]|nr:SLC13 family permease [Rhodothermales bacterium]
MVLLGIIIVLTLTLLITQPIRIEIIAVLLIVVLGVSGLLEPADALSGFSSSATLTVAAMLVLSAGLDRAGVVDYIVSAVTRRAGGGVTSVLLIMAVPVTLFSAFMNNTAIVALMIPVALTVARKTDLSASKLLLPISYLSILGGTCTLIGTSTNILVDSLYREAGGPGFGMFEFSALGLVYLAIGGVYVVMFVPRLLPNRSALGQLMDVQAPGQFFTEVSIPSGSRLVGRGLAET